MTWRWRQEETLVDFLRQRHSVTHYTDDTTCEHPHINFKYNSSTSLDHLWRRTRLRRSPHPEHRLELEDVDLIKMHRVHLSRSSLGTYATQKWTVSCVSSCEKVVYNWRVMWRLNGHRTRKSVNRYCVSSCRLARLTTSSNSSGDKVTHICVGLENPIGSFLNALIESCLIVSWKDVLSSRCYWGRWRTLDSVHINSKKSSKSAATQQRTNSTCKLWVHHDTMPKETASCQVLLKILHSLDWDIHVDLNSDSQCFRFSRDLGFQHVIRTYINEKTKKHDTHISICRGESK